MLLSKLCGNTGFPLAVPPAIIIIVLISLSYCLFGLTRTSPTRVVPNEQTIEGVSNVPSNFEPSVKITYCWASRKPLNVPDTWAVCACTSPMTDPLSCIVSFLHSVIYQSIRLR